jgi:hypothetical protein
MRHATKPRKNLDPIARFSEIFPKGYFKSSQRVAQSLGLFSQALQSGQVVAVVVKPKGWLMKGTKNRRVKLERWKRRKGIATR